MRKIFFITLISSVILTACQSNQKTEIGGGKLTAEDSAAKEAQSAINKMVDEMAPPDTNYSGDFFLKYDNGLMKVKGYFRFGKRHGQWFYYYPNGLVWSEGLFNNGKMDGPSKVYHENGKLYYEGIYKMDLAVGQWNFYDTTAKLAFVRTYDSTGKVLNDKPVTPELKK
ncbi:MAG: toxin-antitoxin system YwqK family antitoxin [Bacteroidia bacterium]